MTTCIVNNFIRGQFDSQDFSFPKLNNIHNLPNQGGNAPETAFDDRDKFKAFFSSPGDRVEWQENVLKT